MPKRAATSRRASSLARELGDQNRIAAVLQTLGQACRGEGDVANAGRYSAESITAARAVGNPRQLASALNSHAQLLRQQGDLAGAESLYRKSCRSCEDWATRKAWRSAG